MAMHVMLEQQSGDEKKANQLLRDLTGPFKTMGPAPKPGEENAPDWWRGEDEAWAQAQVAMGQLRRRRR